ncbi:MAG: hypothetical protein HZA50_12820 [Planctomycetes bacterium]|nr:hypothetical protein [Planctomycetota bacterium]
MVRKKMPRAGMRPEYDFAAMSGGVRGKYAERFRKGTNLVLLDSDVAAVFKSGRDVNKALRSLIGIARTQVPASR